MNEYSYYIDRKVTVWDRDSYTIKAESKEQADEKAKELFANENNWFLDSADLTDEAVEYDSIVFNGTEVQFDTAEDMSVSANDGQATVIMEDDSQKQIACNVENPCDICGKQKMKYTILDAGKVVGERLFCESCNV